MSNIEIAYRNFCRQRFPLPTEKQVAEFERRIGVPLPRDYRHYLLQYNGGGFADPEIFPPSDACPVDCGDFVRLRRRSAHL